MGGHEVMLSADSDVSYQPAIVLDNTSQCTRFRWFDLDD